MRKLLQVRIGDSWEYVFCRNELKALPITTKNPKKALDHRAMDHFKSHFGGLEFRIVRQ